MPNNPTPAAVAKRRPTLYERRRLVQIFLLILLFADAVFGFLTFRPSGLSFEQQQAELTRLIAEGKGRRESVAHLKRVQATLAESNGNGQKFYDTKFLPAATGFSTIMEEVDKLAVSNGVKKGGVTYSTKEVKDRPGIEEVEIDTALEGDYSKIVRFINHLEQSQLFLIVDSLAVGQGSAGQGQGQKGVKLTVKLITFFRVPQGTL